METQAQAGADSGEEIENSLTHIIPRQPFPQYIDDTVFLDVKELLARHPDKHTKAWSERPRLYVLLRMLGYHEESQVFNKFDSESIGDVWLPLASATLEQLASSDLVVSVFFRTQLHVLSKSERMSQEQLLSGDNAHRYIMYGSSQFEKIDMLGSGGSAEVARVRHKLSGKQFACKQICRAAAVRDQRKQLAEFEQEVRVLLRIHHQHLVSFVASYTDLHSFSLILNPVADDVLKSMLSRQSRERPLPESDIQTLRHSYACLATALAYLHEQRVRHKDIKPGNILISDGSVYLCDFGISRDWSKSEHSTTEGDVLKFTRRYCAPEVFGRDPRNTASDIWSLGCVFLELVTVIKGYPLDEMNKFLLDNSVGASGHGLWCAPDAMNAWLAKIRSEGNDSADDLPLDWITPMIRDKPEARLTAPGVVDMIHKQASEIPRPNLFVRRCCARSDSLTSIDAGDIPALTAPFSGGLNIGNVATSPPRSYLEPISHRNPSPGSVGGHRGTSRGSRGETRGRSVSPRTQSPHDSQEAVSFPKDSVPSPNPRPMQRISTLSDSPRTSQSYSLIPSRDSVSSSGFRRSPVPPPASFDVKCFCASREVEMHIWNMPFLSCVLGPNSATMETCPTCEVGENRVQVYETQFQEPDTANSQMPMLWWVTRRLVVSYLSGTPERRRCSSFWLPLADLHFKVSDAEVILRWSDCNQMTEIRSGNYGQHYDWIYNATQPNNELVLRFGTHECAQEFIDCLRLPFADGLAVSHGRKMNISPLQEAFVFDVGKRGVRNYRVVSLTTANNSFSRSKLYVQWPELDIDMRIHDSEVNRFATAPDYQMTITLRNVSTPTYHSDVRGEPAVDHNKIARFNRALQLKTSFAVTFPIGMKHSLPAPPFGTAELLYHLTGWTLRYFAIVEKFRSKNKRFGSKKYGAADIMLWEKEVEDNSIKRRGSQVTFRLHEETDNLWISGSVNASTTISYSSNSEATITVSNKRRGELVDIIKMSATTLESPGKDIRHSRAQSDTNEDLSEMVLTFEDARYRLEFVSLIEYFKAAAAATAPLSRISTSNGNADTIRRINSLASNDIHMSPPMRNTLMPGLRRAGMH